MESQENEKKKRDFLTQIIDELRNTPKSHNFHHTAFSTVAKFGLQLKAKQEKLFEGEDWNNPKIREELVQKIERFLDKQFK
jgi:DNA-binding winged helix-turn-helix (wHTH) protein